jgi:WD40 repeat protein
VAALGVAGIVWQWQSAVASAAEARRAEGEAHDAEEKAVARAEAEARANQAAQLARTKEAEARLAERKAREEEARERGKAEAARKVAQDAQKKAEDERDAKERARAHADGLRLAAEASAARHSDPALALLLALEGVKRAPHRLTFGVLNEALRDCREVKTLDVHVPGVRYSADGRRLVGRTSVVDVATGKEVTALANYPDAVSADISPDGKRAVSTTSGSRSVYYFDGKSPSQHVFTDRVAYIWDTTTGKDVLHVGKHRDQIVSAQFSPDGKQLLTASWDKTACLWDATTGARLHVLKGHQASLRTALFSPDGKTVLTVGSGRLELGFGPLWSWEEEKGARKEGPPLRDPGIIERKGRPDGGDWVRSSSTQPDSPVARLWDARTGKQVAALTKPPVTGVTLTLTLAGKTVSVPTFLLARAFPVLSYVSWFTGHSGHPTAAAFRPDGKRVAIAFKEGVACLWGPHGGGPEAFLRGHKGALRVALFSPDGRHLVTAGDDPFAIVWDGESGKELRRLWGHQGSITIVRFSRNGRHVLTGSSDGTARLYDVTTAEEQAVFRGHRRGVYSVDFSPDGAHVVTSSGDGTTRIWQIASPQELALVLRGHEGKLNSLSFSPDGKRLLSAGDDETPRLWDAVTGREALRIGQGKYLGQVRMARFSADGQRIVTASTNTQVRVDGKLVNASAVHVWGAEKGDDLLALKEHLNGALHAQFSPDGKRLLTLSDGNIAVHNKGRFVKTEQETSGNLYPGLLRLWDAQTGKLLVALKQKQDRNGLVNRLSFVPVFSPDSRHLLMADDGSRHFLLLEANTGKTIANLRQEHEGLGMRRLNAAFSPDGRRIFTTVGGNSALIWDARTGGALARLRGFEAGVSTGTFSPDGRRLATLSGNIASIWEVESRRLLATLRGHEAQALTAAFSPDGRYLVTGADNGEALLWDAKSGKTLALFAGHTRSVNLVAFSADGARVATGSADGTARIWPVDLLAAARRRRPRELTATERVRYALTPRPKTSEPTALPEPGTEGGLSNGPKRLLPEEDEKASAWLDRLRGEMARAGADRGKVRAELLALRRTYPGTAQAVGAATLLARLPSPLDRLPPDDVPVGNRFAGQPKELVAVLGERRLRHTDPVDRALVSKDGRLVISSARQAHLWDAATGEARGGLAGRLRGMIAQTGAVVTEDTKGLRYWDVSGAKPRELGAVPFPGIVATISPDGKIVEFRSSGAIRLWGVQAGKANLWAVLPGHKARDTRAVFSADGKRVATCGYDELLRVWALDGARPRQLFRIVGSARQHAAIALSPDGNVLVASGDDGSLRLWDLSGPKLKEWPGMKLRYRAGALAFAPDGKLLAVPGGGSRSLVRLYQVSSAGLRPVADLRGHAGWVNALAFSRDGKVLVSGGDDRALRIWDLRGAPKERVALRGHTGGVSGLAFAPDRPVLASNSQDGTTRLWDLTGNGRELAVFEGGWGAVAFSPDGKGLAAGSGPSSLRLWDASGAKPRLRAALPAHSFIPFSFGFTGDGRYLVSGGFTPILRGWDVSLDKPQPWVSLPDDKKRTGVASLAVSPDGTLLVAARYAEDRRLLAWRITASGIRAVPFPKTEARLVALSPNGKTLASATGPLIRVWDISAPVPTIKAEPAGHQVGYFGSTVAALAFSPDGRWLASVGEDGLVVVSEAATGAKQHEWKLPGGGQAVAFAPDRRHIAVGNKSGTIYVLRLAGPEK